jgi:hypothetical protein
MSDHNLTKVEWGACDLSNIPPYYKQWDIFTALRQAIASNNNQVIQNILGNGSSYDGNDLNTWPVWSLETTLEYLDMCGRNVMPDSSSGVPMDYKTNFRYICLLRYILDNNLDVFITGSLEEEEGNDWGLELVHGTLVDIRAHYHFKRDKNKRK